MTTDEELLALVRQVGPDVEDTARAALADWLEEHPQYQRTPIKKNRLPTGFSRWWQKTNTRNTG